MSLMMKCADGVHRSPVAALEYRDVQFVQYEVETPTPEPRDEPAAPVEIEDVR